MAQSSSQERELNERSLLTTESASNAVVKVFRVVADQSPHKCSPQVRRCRDDVPTMEVVLSRLPSTPRGRARDTALHLLGAGRQANPNFWTGCAVVWVPLLLLPAAGSHRRCPFLHDICLFPGETCIPSSIHSPVWLSNHFLHQSETIPVDPFVDFVSLNFLHQRREEALRFLVMDRLVGLWLFTFGAVVRARSMSLGCVSIFRIRILAYVYYVLSLCSAGTAANEPHQDTPASAERDPPGPRATRLMSKVAHIPSLWVPQVSHSLTPVSVQGHPTRSARNFCPRRFAVIWGLATSSWEWSGAHALCLLVAAATAAMSFLKDCERCL